MNDQIIGNTFSMLAILPVLLSVIVFFMLRGPNADIYVMTIIFSISSIIGIVFSIIISLKFKRHVTSAIALVANLFILAFAYLLLLAMGISEP